MNTSKITVYRNQKPAKNVRVRLGFSGIVNLGFSKDFYTDSNGVAYVEHSATGNAEVYLDGKEVGRLYTPGQDVFYL